jgi:putrescine transport system substrate-binding protein
LYRRIDACGRGYSGAAACCIRTGRDWDAPHVTHALINYLLRPEVAARNTNHVFYANGDRPTASIDRSILDDRTIYPDAPAMVQLYTLIAHDQKTERLMNRLWERIKTGD